ncbi:MAG TPA: glycerol-3-phosphate dehydrogenase [Rhodobacteraceae bacterium]|nr:glycerol-3-phosphate dehydrogenase [Paracoccaceae bacterium]
MVIIGGGINGCGVARDAAGRGLQVLLAEKGDLAGGTSSASTKLIHGGLRYLEYYEFRLVREALSEREVLLAAAPHIIAPMRFILPHHPGLRPAWLIRIGLFLYDHLGGRKVLPPSRQLDLRRDCSGASLKKMFKKGFEYSDCQVDDARLVVLTAIDAHEKGADIRVGTRMMQARREAGLWRIVLQDAETKQTETVSARVLVNAAGPWVGEVAAHSEGAGKARDSVRLVKGSHIVVPRLYDHDRAYIFQNRDKRIVFAIPYEHDFTLIGTTDVDVPGGPGKVEASEEEIDYLCKAVSEYFIIPVTPDDVVWSFAGIRPLFNDGGESAQETTRDYVLDLQTGKPGSEEAPLLNIYGGKITSYRELAEEIMGRLKRFFPDLGPDWTHDAALPGGDIKSGNIDDLVAAFRHEHPHLPAGLARRLCHAYGTRVSMIADGVDTLADMGRHFGADLYEREVVYLLEHEWARSAGDIVWRRSKLGLRLKTREIEELSDWLAARGERKVVSLNA